MEHGPSLLAGALATLFAIAIAHCIVFLDSIDTRIRFQLTFVDVVNTTTYTSPGPIFLALGALILYLGSISVYRSFQPKRKIIIYTNTIIFFIICAVFLKPFIAHIGMIIGLPTFFGLFMTLCMAYYTPARNVLQKGFKKASHEDRLLFFVFLPILALPPVVLALTSVVASQRATIVKQCEEPDTIISTEAMGQKLVRQACNIMSLERGMLVYDKAVSTAVLIPWSQFVEFRRPIGGSRASTVVEKRSAAPKGQRQGL